MLMGFISSTKQDLIGNVHNTLTIRDCFIFLENGLNKIFVYNKRVQGIILGPDVIGVSFQIYMDTAHLQADGMTRVSLDYDIRLGRKAFMKVWRAYGPFGMMASPANVQKDLQAKKLLM